MEKKYSIKGNPSMFRGLISVLDHRLQVERGERSRFYSLLTESDSVLAPYLLIAADGQPFGRVVAQETPNGKTLTVSVPDDNDWSLAEETVGLLLAELEEQGFEPQPFGKTAPAPMRPECPRPYSKPWNQWQDVWTRIRAQHQRHSPEELEDWLTAQPNKLPWIPKPSTIRKIVLAGKAGLLDLRRIKD